MLLDEVCRIRRKRRIFSAEFDLRLRKLPFYADTDPIASFRRKPLETSTNANPLHGGADYRRTHADTILGGKKSLEQRSYCYDRKTRNPQPSHHATPLFIE